MRPLYFYSIIFPAVLSLAGCVSTGKFKDMQQQAQKNDSLYTWAMHTLKTCQGDNDNLNQQKSSLQNQLNSTNSLLTASNENNTQLRRQLQDLSAISSAQAESIKNSLDNMSAKDIYLIDLRSALAHRDSVNLAVLMELKMALGSFGDHDVNIKLEKGVVSVDLSDSLLFSNDTNSYALTAKAKSVLGRLARVFRDQPGLEFMVEGHPDSVPSDSVHSDSLHPDSLHIDSVLYTPGVLPGNWDLSVKRATAVVRMLQDQYSIAPVRMTAAGRSTPGRSTRVVIFPQLDPLLRVLEHKQGQAAPAAPAAPTPPATSATPASPTAPPTSTAPSAAAPAPGRSKFRKTAALG
jgi:chemotaxis protein MotB